jgi:hypothetical protein
VRWIFLFIFLAAIAWTAISRNPYAQGVRGLFGRTPDLSILDRTFTMGPRGFRFYKFSLPEGSANMAVAGKFSVSGDTSDNTIELLIIGEDQLNAWEAGSQVQAIYSSGRVQTADVQIDLPEGAGTFLVLISNKFSTSGVKKIMANFVLKHRNWWR